MDWSHKLLFTAFLILAAAIDGTKGHAMVTGTVFCDQCKDGQISLFDYPAQGVKVAVTCTGTNGQIIMSREETTNLFGNYAMRFDGTPDLSNCYAQVSGIGQGSTDCGAPGLKLEAVEMQGLVAFTGPMCVSSPVASWNWDSRPRNYFLRKTEYPLAVLHEGHFFSLLSTALPKHHCFLQKYNRRHSHVSLKASSSVGSAAYTEEPATNVKFQKSLRLPGCSSSLSLLGTGFREKVFAIIGVKVYAAGLYINESILSGLNAQQGCTPAESQKDSSLFNSIFQAPLEKSLQIILVRDIDGKTFWDALDDAISPRIKSPTPIDESALSTFRGIFQGRPLKKGTAIFLTWLDPSKMLVCVSSAGLPSEVDATIESPNVTLALFDVFFGDTPVSPSLKSSVADQLGTILK